jgi:DNA polymerase delta subunit 2
MMLIALHCSLSLHLCVRLLRNVLESHLIVCRVSTNSTMATTVAVATTTTTRAYAEQTPAWQRFQTTRLVPCTEAAAATTTVTPTTLQQHLYQRQYAHVYHQRLQQLAPVIWRRIAHHAEQQRTTSTTPTTTAAVNVPRILELPEDVASTVVGTIVLEPTADSNSNSSNSTNKQAYLEDESGRVALAFSNRHHEPYPMVLCTGVVLGVTGTVGMDGVLHVTAVYTAAEVVGTTVVDPPTVTGSVPLAQRDATTTTKQPHILLLSGLDCGSPHASSLSRDMLVSYLQGLLGQQHDTKAALVTHVIVAGGLICSSDSDRDHSVTTTTQGCRELDGFLHQLTHATGVPVSILPGKHDPTTANWPQRPLHTSLVPRSTSSSTANTSLLSRSPNPYAANFAVPNTTTTHTTTTTRYVLGTDGTNVADWVAQTHVSPLTALEQTLAYQHVCPTGPDSVPTAPHPETDPMVIASGSTMQQQQPSIYFSGGAPHFGTKVVHVQTATAVTESLDAPVLATTMCRLVCVPKFIDTGLAVLVNLETLAVELLRFDDSSS